MKNRDYDTYRTEDQRNYESDRDRDFGREYDRDERNDRSWGNRENQRTMNRGGSGQNFNEQYGRGENRGYGGTGGQSGRDWGQSYSGSGGYGGTGRDYGTAPRGYGQEGVYGQNYGQSSSRDWTRRGQYTGHGPKGYRRSDERIKEDICERLTQHPDIDASDVEIDVRGGEVTLKGTVNTRQQKRMAEDITEDVFGVNEIHNQLRLQSQGNQGQRSSQGQQGQRGTRNETTRPEGTKKNRAA